MRSIGLIKTNKLNMKDQNRVYLAQILTVQFHINRLFLETSIREIRCEFYRNKKLLPFEYLNKGKEVCLKKENKNNQLQLQITI